MITQAQALAVLIAAGALVAGCSASAESEGLPLPPIAVVTAPTDSSTTTTTPPARALGTSGPDERLRRIEVAVSGDILIHEGVWQSATAHAGGEGFDFVPMFAALAPLLSSTDLSLCHLEVPLSSTNADLSSYPRFNAPFELADGLAAAGFDGCSVASNHVLDQGVSGIDSTLGHLDRVGLGHSGAARTPEEADALTWYEVRGIRVAHLSYTYGYNGLRPPAGQEWRSNLNSVEAIASDTARARREGADLVLLSIHWGDEYVHTPNASQRDLAAALDELAEIDLVIGHHAHVIQTVAMVGDTPVIYGLGNLLSNMGQAERRDGVVVVATFEAGPGEPFAMVKMTALPTFVDRPGHYIVPAPSDSWARTMGHLGAGGLEVLPREVPQFPVGPGVT